MQSWKQLPSGVWVPQGYESPQDTPAWTKPGWWKPKKGETPKIKVLPPLAGITDSVVAQNAAAKLGADMDAASINNAMNYKAQFSWPLPSMFHHTPTPMQLFPHAQEKTPPDFKQSKKITNPLGWLHEIVFGAKTPSVNKVTSRATCAACGSSHMAMDPNSAGSCVLCIHCQFDVWIQEETERYRKERAQRKIV